MGLKDTAAKNFFGRADILSFLLDYLLYDGKPTVQAGQQKEVNGESNRIVQDETGRFRTDNRFWDKLFEFDTDEGRLSVGLEFQSRDDKQMVMRIMRYDVRRHTEMLSSGPSAAERHCYDYGFVSLNIYDLAEKSKLFPCNELKKVLHYFRHDQDSGQLEKAVTEGMLKGCLSRDAAHWCARPFWI